MYTQHQLRQHCNKKKQYIHVGLVILLKSDKDTLGNKGVSAGIVIPAAEPALTAKCHIFAIALRDFTLVILSIWK